MAGGRRAHLPREAAAEKVHEHKAEGLEVVAAALLYAKVRVHACVSRRACQVLVVTVWNMFEVSRGPVALGEAKVDTCDLVLARSEAHQKVVGLHISV
jgi:hypothetical protein